MTTKNTKAESHTPFHNTLTDAGVKLADVDEHGNFARMVDAAGAAADRLLLRAAVGEIDGFESTETIARLVQEVRPEVQQQTDALEAYLMEQQPPMDRVKDGIPALVAWSHGEAGYLLGLAIGLKLGSGR